MGSQQRLGTAVASAVLAFALGHPAAAAPDTDASIRVAFRQAYRDLGRPEATRKELKRSERLFRKVIVALPDRPGGHRGLGLVLRRLGDCEGALVALKRYEEVLRERSPDVAPLPAATSARRVCESRRRSLGADRGGVVVVRAFPPGGQVSLDGKPAGRAPVRLAGVKAGPHLVRGTLAGHTAAQAEVVVKSGGIVTAALRHQRLATLELLSAPAGALVTVAGERRGATPAQIDQLPPGPQRLEVAAAEGDRPWVGTVAALPGQALTLSIPLVAAGGEVEIVSEPPGAAVTIDDRPVGHAPIGPNLLSPGPHRIELMLPGFGLESRRITLAEGQSQVVRAELAPVHLDVRLRGLSEDLSVSLDGELVSADGEWIRQVPPGWHDLAASRGGVEVWARRLRVGTDGGNELRVDAAASGGVSPTRGVRRWGGLAAAAAGLLAAAALMPEPGGGIADYAAPAGLATVGAAAAIVSIVAWTESGASLRAAPSPRLDR